MTDIAISKNVEFDAGHRVPMHESKCKNPHGHRYKIEAICTGAIITDPESPEYGMLTDFSRLKEFLTHYIHDVLDHAMIIHKDDEDFLDAMSGHGWRIVVFPYVPTAENLARWAWQELQPALETAYGDTLTLTQIAVWETPTSVAYYRGN